MTSTGVPPMIGSFLVEDGDLDAPFWSGLSRHEVVLQRCRGCACWIWGPQWRCGACGSWDIGWEPVAAEGVVHSWTRTWHAVAAEVAGRVPYVVVLVDVAGTGCRLLGIWLADGDPQLGQAVGVVWPAAGEVRDNPYALAWRPRP